MPIYIWRKKTPFSCRCSLKTAPLCPISQYFIVFHSMSVDEIPSYIPIISLLSSCFPFRKSPHILDHWTILDAQLWIPWAPRPCSMPATSTTPHAWTKSSICCSGRRWKLAEKGGCLIHVSILNIYIYIIFMYLYHIYIYICVCVIYLLYTLMLVYHCASCCFLR